MGKLRGGGDEVERRLGLKYLPLTHRLRSWLWWYFHENDWNLCQIIIWTINSFAWKFKWIILLPNIYKRSNIILVHKKVTKVKTTAQIPSYPLGKYLKEITFKKNYNFLLKERLLNLTQSCFPPFDLSINQLLSITHEIFEAFDWTSRLKLWLKASEKI